MEIKEIYEPFFQENAGIIIDDAYDIHKRLVYDKYITSNKIEYIYAQDNDISNFSFLSFKAILPRKNGEFNVYIPPITNTVKIMFF